MGLFNFVPGVVRKLVDDSIDRRMNEAGRQAVAMARDLVPVDTGYLQSTIGYTYDQARHLLILHADAKYAAVVEEGSIKQRAQPYLRPALNAVGKVWGGNFQISYPNAYHLSGKKGPAHIARFNEAVSRRLHRGASRRARVRYQHGGTVERSREVFLWEPVVFLAETTPLI